ncbi:MAG: hypothetical protein ACJ8AI_28385, partial [Rhodopila sp.]
MLIPKASHLVERVAERLLRSGALDDTAAQLLQPGSAPKPEEAGPQAPDAQEGAPGPGTPQPAAAPFTLPAAARSAPSQPSADPASPPTANAGLSPTASPDGYPDSDVTIAPNVVPSSAGSKFTPFPAAPIGLPLLAASSATPQQVTPGPAVPSSPGAPPIPGRTRPPGDAARPASPLPQYPLIEATGPMQGALQAVDAVALERAGMVDWSRTRTRISEEFRLVQRQILRSAFGPGA